MLTGNVGAVTEYCYMIQNTCYGCEYVFVWIEVDSAVCGVAWCGVVWCGVQYILRVEKTFDLITKLPLSALIRVLRAPSFN